MNEVQIDTLLQKIEPFIPYGKNSLNEHLNPDFAYLIWIKHKSLGAAAKYLKDIGVRSYVGKPYSRQAIHIAASHSKYYDEAKARAQTKSKKLVKRIREDAKKSA